LALHLNLLECSSGIIHVAEFFFQPLFSFSLSPDPAEKNDRNLDVAFFVKHFFHCQLASQLPNSNAFVGAGAAARLSVTHTVDGSEIRRSPVDMVNIPCRVLYIPGAGYFPSTVSYHCHLIEFLMHFYLIFS